MCAVVGFVAGEMRMGPWQHGHVTCVLTNTLALHAHGIGQVRCSENAAVATSCTKRTRGIIEARPKAVQSHTNAGARVEACVQQ